ncbi:uncharacterized protein LOC127284011 isoform X2 [Leptopilina boulardi]|uniref:uncharacterized protein LOC127284011 isoform X2 n=1 Tax=Leptopilina boulardi TaxID=63433 RepID=UPI0021F62CF2|nr:uncharacterized protein LOC127284011 isoform X2 [Leptopilina boulardi]
MKFKQTGTETEHYLEKALIRINIHNQKLRYTFFLHLDLYKPRLSSVSDSSAPGGKSVATQKIDSEKRYSLVGRYAVSPTKASLEIGKTDIKHRISCRA